MDKPIEYTTKVGDQLVIWITGDATIYIAEVTQEEPLQMKVEETGPFAHLKDGDYIIREVLTTKWQEDGLEKQRLLYAAKMAGMPYVSGLKSLGVEDNQLREILSNAVFAPFTLEQVVYLEIWQKVLPVHPFTCGNDHKGARDLIPTREGWECPSCDYTQDWCDASNCEKPEWEPIQDAIQYEFNKGILERLRMLYQDQLPMSFLTNNKEETPRLLLLIAEARAVRDILHLYDLFGPSNPEAPSSKEDPPQQIGGDAE